MNERSDTAPRSKTLLRICPTEFETQDGLRRLIACRPSEWYICDREAIVLHGPYASAVNAALAFGWKIPQAADGD